MRFRFSTFNHCDMGKRGLEDLIAIVGGQMTALGHVVDHDGQFLHGEDGVNVLIEAFDDPAHLDRIADARERGCRFLYIATEEPTKNGFNHGVAPGMIDRQHAFPAAAQYADGILHLVPGADVTRWYAQFAPAACAELGHAPSMVYEGPAVAPEYDFGFYGQVTYRRQKILDRLRELGSVHVLPNIALPAAARDAEMRRVRTVVTIREHDDMGFVSSSRCATALCLGRPVVGEPHAVSRGWDQVVRFSNSLESFYFDAKDAAFTWEALHARQFAKFKELFSPEACIGRPLSEIGITKGNP